MLFRHSVRLSDGCYEVALLLPIIIELDYFRAGTFTFIHVLVTFTFCSLYKSARHSHVLRASGLSLPMGMICLALDEIVSDGVVEATDWDTVRRGIKLKMNASGD